MNLKTFIIGIAFFALFSKLNAQVDILGQFNFLQIGKNYNIAVRKSFSQHALIAGFTWHQNFLTHDNQNNMFKNRVFATNFREHLGFNLGYAYVFSLQHSSIEPFAFYDFQYLYCGTRNQDYAPFGFIHNKHLYVRIIERFDPMHILQNNIGIGFQCQLFKKLSLYQKAGFGFVNYRDIDERILGIGRNPFVLGYIASIGLSYQIGRE